MDTTPTATPTATTVVENLWIYLKVNWRKSVLIKRQLCAVAGMSLEKEEEIFLLILGDAFVTGRLGHHLLVLREIER